MDELKCKAQYDKESRREKIILIIVKERYI